jgi:RHS repeat-associated protein
MKSQRDYPQPEACGPQPAASVAGLPTAYSLQSTACFFTDRLGTVRNGGKSYYPFGEEIGTPSANNAFKFASTYRDSNSGLDYAHHRYYSSGMARFLSADPARARRHSPGSWNRHRYAGNDPVNRIDPLGLDDYTDFLCLVYGDCEGGGEEEPYDVGFKVKVVATAPLPEPLDTVPSELPPLAPPPGDEPGGGGGGGGGGDGGDGGDGGGDGGDGGDGGGAGGGGGGGGGSLCQQCWRNEASNCSAERRQCEDRAYAFWTVCVAGCSTMFCREICNITYTRHITDCTDESTVCMKYIPLKCRAYCN